MEPVVILAVAAAASFCSSTTRTGFTTPLTFIAFLNDPEPISQSPAFDPAEPEPIPEDDFHQSWEA